MVLHTPAPEPRTMLQKHLDYFDPDHDDVFSPYDTFVGFRDLAYPRWSAAIAALLVHLALSYKTLPKYKAAEQRFTLATFIASIPHRIWSYIPDPLLRIHLDNIGGIVHKSDPQMFNDQGEFDSQKFEKLFEMYSSAPNRDSLTRSDVMRIWRSQRSLGLFRYIGEGLKWLGRWYTVSPRSGSMTKDELRGCYDGSILYLLAEQRTGQVGSTKTASNHVAPADEMAPLLSSDVSE
ncbi:hypothetical protein DL93DRAFT_2083803 [Clavulina sp. PMI_390]|nr:hypothetical protein DL93DRAFT_2083803 [Clavulina sp. PMI_390]